MAKRWLTILVAVLAPQLAWSAVAPVVVGKVRVHALSATLVRLEEMGPRGFEDRVTFTVVKRDWPGVPLQRTETAREVRLTGPSWRVVIPKPATSLKGVRVESLRGQALYTVDTPLPKPAFLPAPGQMPAAWVMADQPRLVPPPWGALPPPAGHQQDKDAGWDAGNNAPDIYVFLPQGQAQLRQEYLALTGPIPLPPLFTFGYWTSRYHAYSEATALQDIERFRAKGIPLDLFVVDTDWRQGASHGYAVNPQYYPDMGRFIREAHARNVRLMFNDHPEPQAGPLEVKELQYRWDGLTSLLALGADVWWYDRNWITKLAEPAPGLSKEVWGMRLYHDITQAFRPGQRPLVMSNAEGIDNGHRRGPPSPAAHRFPIWWTGDTYADWPFLEMAVANTVDSGALAAVPYVHDDCGGFALRSIPELQVRFFQFCAFSPVLRSHSSKGRSRLPWDFGPEAEEIITEYARLRYRLLPVLYSAAHRAHVDGTPLLRRLDLEWPASPEAASSTQYLLGDDLLVAPVMAPAVDLQPVPLESLEADGKTGVHLVMFAGQTPEAPLYQGVVPQVLFHGWPVEGGRPVAGGLGARWSTRWKDVPETGDYVFRVDGWGRTRLWLNGQVVIDDLRTINDAPTLVTLQKGSNVDMVVEQLPVNAVLHVELQVAPPSRVKRSVTRLVWLPPGEWEDAWSGERLDGPGNVTVAAPLRQLPLFVRAGGVVLGLPQLQSTDGQTWTAVVADAYVPRADGTQTRLLYEDDGLSNAYLEGASRQTPVTLERRGNAVTLRVGAAVGTAAGLPARRAWTLRLHLPPGAQPRQVQVDGQACAACGILAADSSVPRIPFLGAGSPPPPQAGPVLEINLGDTPVDRETLVQLAL